MTWVKTLTSEIQTGERTINPDGSVGGTRYIDVARAAPSQSGLGFLADYVLPFAASFIYRRRLRYWARLLAPEHQVQLRVVALKMR